MRALVATCRVEWPNTSMCPLVGFKRPRMSLTVVDLPEPLGPSKPKTSPLRTSKSTLSTARALGRPQKSLKTLVSPRTVTTASFAVTDRGAGPVLISVSGIILDPGETLFELLEFEGANLSPHLVDVHAATLAVNCGAGAAGGTRPVAPEASGSSAG